ncbi:acetyl-CoA carboxylase biotin carboxylase subunit family protein [Amorphus sp. 3PC139-8]|uniref:ATP-grasp domain-containing protein n=1 Tax=Amorphus sp. 3PC139-8 TaxID=2735676 RepID=UPI00345D842E
MSKSGSTHRAQEAAKTVFVVGLEPFNQRLLQDLDGSERFVFQDLLGYAEAVRPVSGEIDLDLLLETAERRLACHDGPIDAIIGYWDFPTSVITPILAQRHGLPAPHLEAVAACEHKYWSRLEQARSIPDMTPGFSAFDPFADDPLAEIDLPFPFWIKPIKAHSSFLGFKIHNAEDFAAHLPTIRAGIGHFGRPFDQFLDMVNVPPELAGIGGHHMIAEEIISEGLQCTLEGFVYGGAASVYGVIDSIRSGQHRSSFARYQYPTTLPHAVQARMAAAIGRFLQHIGYDNAAFNAEFFWSPGSDRLWILEVNTRLSKSHAPMFLMVDGQTHQKVPIDIALGRCPDLPHRAGAHALAAKFMVRVFEDGVVDKVPSADDLDRFHRRFADGMVRVLAHEDMRLAHLSYQDSYSYELMEVFLGAMDQPSLLAAYRQALDLLPIHVAPIREAFT